MIISPPDQAETVSRRVEKFAELMQSVWLSKNDYERRIRLVNLLPSCTLTTLKSVRATASVQSPGGAIKLVRKPLFGHLR